MTKTILMVLVLASGCSIALQDRPTTKGPIAASCTNKYWIADAVGVAAGVASIAAGIVLGVTNENDDWTTGNIVAGAGALVGIGYTASMGNGIRWSGECRSASPSIASR